MQPPGAQTGAGPSAHSRPRRTGTLLRPQPTSGKAGRRAPGPPPPRSCRADASAASAKPTQITTVATTAPPSLTPHWQHFKRCRWRLSFQVAAPVLPPRRGPPARDDCSENSRLRPLRDGVDWHGGGCMISGAVVATAAAGAGSGGSSGGGGEPGEGGR
jgi:hypothetical protein